MAILVTSLSPSIYASFCNDVTDISQLPCTVRTPAINCSGSAFIYDISNMAINYSATTSIVDVGCSGLCQYDFDFLYSNRGNYRINLCDNYTYAFININGNKISMSSGNREVFSPYSYPYVDVNISYPMSYQIFVNNVSINVGNLNISVDGSDIPFIWNSQSNSYLLTIIFNSVGDFPFSIYGNSSYPDFTGTFLVRNPYYVTFCGYKNGNSYVNNDAYLTAEFTSSQKFYDANLEQFITPFSLGLLGNATFKTPVFHTFYVDGCGTLKLYDKNEYAIRLISGDISFQTTFSPPEIAKNYGTNIYVGKYIFDGTNQNIKMIFTNKDTNSYGWLFNWLSVIIIIGSVLVTIFLFFFIPDMPFISLVFFIIMVGGTIIGRTVIWFFLG